MVGIGTGFNEKIVDSLLKFLEACYEGLLEEIKKGTPPEEAIQKEFKELKEYIELIQKHYEQQKVTVTK